MCLVKTHKNLAKMLGKGQKGMRGGGGGGGGGGEDQGLSESHL